jgi:hypothetical protein
MLVGSAVSVGEEGGGGSGGVVYVCLSSGMRLGIVLWTVVWRVGERGSVIYVLCVFIKNIKYGLV